MAADALLTAMDFYFEDGRAVPDPSVPSPLSVWAKVQLLNLRIQKIDTLAAAFHAMDSELSIAVIPAI